MNHICPTCFRPLEPSEDLQVSLDENCVIWKGIVVQLTPTETEIVVVLTSALGWANNEAIYEKVYASSDWPQERAINVHMSNIRRKFRDAQIPITVENSFFRKGGGRQYRLKYGF